MFKIYTSARKMFVFKSWTNFSLVFLGFSWTGYFVTSHLHSKKFEHPLINEAIRLVGQNQ